MAKVLLAKNVPADEVDDVQKTFENLGATNIKKTENADGTFNLEGTFAD
jgi:hypothetical protein